MDELSHYNQARWEELAQANVEFTQPMLDLTVELARQRWDKEGFIGDAAGKNVLCLAASGGQQSVLFGLLRANVTVFDLAPTQLERDHEAALHYGYPIETLVGDMRDLSAFQTNHFDFVYQAYSINFVPSTESVFAEVARVLRAGGYYHLQWANPFTQSVDDEAWDGETYLLQHPYIDGFEITQYYPHWDVEDGKGGWRKIDSPKEYRHTLGTVLNGLIAQGFRIEHFQEALNSNPDPAPGTWEHFKSIAPPYFTVWSQLVFEGG
ncbi:MAG: class I SAM-dependent methyltransferase [Chloroflexota bacterium]